MSETELRGIKRLKLVNRNVAIVIGIIAIFLLVILAGTVVLYSSYISTHSHSDSEYSALQNQVNDITNQLNLNKSVVWVNETVNNFASWNFNTSSSGYVNVQIDNATPNTYIAVDYAYYAGAFFGGYFPTANSFEAGDFGSGYGLVTFDFPVIASQIWLVYPSNNAVGVFITIGNFTTTNVTIRYVY